VNSNIFGWHQLVLASKKYFYVAQPQVALSIATPCWRMRVAGWEGS